MKETGIFRRVKGVLVPSDERSEEILDSVKDGTEVAVLIRTPRNLDQLKLYWALMTICADNIEVFKDKNDASNQLKIDTGCVDWVIHHRTGAVIGVPKSIALESMPQAEFNRFLERIFFVLERDYAPGCSNVFRLEMYSMIDGPERSSLGRRAA